MAQGLPVFQNFNISESGADARWTKWCSRLENLLICMDVKDDKRKRALLLHYAGEDVCDIFDTLPNTGDDYATAKKALTDYFAPKKNTEFEIYRFRQAKQEASECMDVFHTRLRKLSENCEFHDRDKEIKSQIIQGCGSTRLRRKALREDLKLEDLIKEARALELSDKQAAEIENKEVNALSQRQSKRRRRPNPEKQSQKPGPDTPAPEESRTCRNCGLEYPHKTKCPAQGKKCNFCKKLNHFEVVCRSKKRQVNKVYDSGHSDTDSNTNSDDQENFCFGLNLIFGEHQTIPPKTVNALSSKPVISVTVDRNKVKTLIDTGSTINVIDEDTYSRMSPKPKLSKTDSKVYAYGTNNTVHLLGKFQATVETESKITTAPVYVAKGKCGNHNFYNPHWAEEI